MTEKRFVATAISLSTSATSMQVNVVVGGHPGLSMGLRYAKHTMSGDDALSNLVLICPNHHRAIHRCDAPFDFEHNAFMFPNITEGLTQVQHVLEARRKARFRAGWPPTVAPPAACRRGRTLGSLRVGSA